MTQLLDPQVRHHFGEGVYAKEQHLPAGQFVATHSHAMDHLTILAQGVVTVEVDGEKKEYRAPSCILIKRGAAHHLEAIEDSTWYCVWATDDTDPSSIDRAVIA